MTLQHSFTKVSNVWYMSAVDWVCKKISLESASEELSAIMISCQQVLPSRPDAYANVITCCWVLQTWSQACNIWEYLLQKPFPRNEVLRIVFLWPWNPNNDLTQGWLSALLMAHGWLVLAFGSWNDQTYCIYSSQFTMILLPLRPASLTHENSQGWKIIDGWHPLGCNDRLRSIDRSKDVFWRMYYLCDFKYELKASPTQKSN